MSRKYKNIIKLRNSAYGPERRKNLAKEILKDSTPIPKPLEYKDIDEEFKRWVEQDLDISFEGEKLPTIALFSNQRFSEYMQSWANVDDKKNLLMNFKIITREPNPKAGSLVGETRNIPGERTYLMRRVPARDRNNRPYFIDYRVKQPFTVDLIYTVNVVTSKYQLLNDFNLMMNDKFKAIDCYIRPNGHFIPMELTDISDESEYSIDNRQFYSQSYMIKVKAYIITRDSYKVVETPMLKLYGFEEGGRSKSYAQIEELESCEMQKEEQEENTEKETEVPATITIHVSECSSTYKFKLDCDFKSSGSTNSNIRYYKVSVNGEREIEFMFDTPVMLHNGDEIVVNNVIRQKMNEPSEIKINGFVIYKSYEEREYPDEEEIDVYPNKEK